LNRSQEESCVFEHSENSQTKGNGYNQENLGFTSVFLNKHGTNPTNECHANKKHQVFRTGPAIENQRENKHCDVFLSCFFKYYL